jgi:hypothetical protein
MYLIARARAFVGTSLHGNITALSYAVPHLGLTESIPKLASFLETWDLSEQQACVPLDGFGAKLEAVLRIAKSALEEKRQQVIQACLQNFAALFEQIGVQEEPWAPAPAAKTAGQQSSLASPVDFATARWVESASEACHVGEFR